MIDILIIFGSALLGIICSLFIFQVIKLRKESQIRFLGSVKYELNNLFFEKSVALEALNRINQYFKEGKIDIYEKDRLSLKYTNLLNEYDKRAFQLNPILEVQEIYEYRNQLNSILSEYIKKIDSKLTDFTKNNDNNKSNPLDKIKNENEKDNETIVSPIKHPDSFLNKIKLMVSSSSSSNTNKLSASGIKFGGKVDYKQQSSIEQQSPQIKDDEIQAQDAKQVSKTNLNLSEIDKIQNDILKTLKRLEDS